VNPDKSKFMSLDVRESLDEGDTVGILDGFEPGPTTVTFSDEEAAFRLKANDELVGDEESRIFVASDGGDLSLGYGPHFDATIVSNLRRSQLQTALNHLRQAGETRATGAFDVHFDHAGPIVFEGEILVATTPARFPWDFASPERPTTGPCGPTIGGGALDE